MEFFIAAKSDIGISRKTNQDSLSIKIANSELGKIAFAVLCDGMGGLSKGEVASASVVNAFSNWFANVFPNLNPYAIDDQIIKQQWEKIVIEQNNKIMQYGRSNKINLGTTATVLLIVQNRFYCLNVGDSRAYVISDKIRQITEDQTVVAQEVKYGKLTAEQAKSDPRKNVLLQCIGSSQTVNADMFFGEVTSDMVFLLCSDGFRHEISSEEIFSSFNPQKLKSVSIANENITNLIELNKQRMEKDNISVALIRTL